MIKRRIAAFSAALIMAATAAAPMPISAQDTQSGNAVVYGATYVTVNFNATGGSCSTKSKVVTYGKTYGTLPTPSKSGYKFTGWYDGSGNKYTSSTVCRKKTSHTLYAHWEKNSNQTCTLKFNGNGGNVSRTSQTYRAGQIVGALPTARKNGYTFKGWYTKKSGGTRISYNTVLSSVKNRTFYAQYSVPSQATLKYKFDNSYSGFNIGYDYTIPLSIYEYMYDDDDAFWYWMLYGQDWGGNCFGMSATSAFFNTGKIKVQSFDKKEYFIKDLDLTDRNSSLGLNVRQFIECMQVAQLSDNMQNVIRKNYGRYSAMVNQVKDCQNGKGKPVVLGISSRYGGHAVLAYKWKKINSTTERLYVYDCNWPDKTCYVTLKKRNGNYTGFTFDFGAGSGTANSAYGDSLTYFNFTSIWNEWNRRDNKSKYSMLSTDAKNAEIYDSEGVLRARITDGVLESYTEDIYSATLFDASCDDLLIYLPDDEYSLYNTDGGEITASLHFDGSTCTVRSGASVLRLCAGSEPTARISADEGDEYSVTIRKGGSEYTQDGVAEADGTLTVDESGENFEYDEEYAADEEYEEDYADEEQAVTEIDTSSAE